MKIVIALLTLNLCTGSALAQAAAASPAPVGILVMAHGGKPDWEAGLLEALKDLRQRALLEVAFGMASASTMQDAVTRLEQRGAQRISVVRLFVSGESFLSETRKILGLDPGGASRPKDAPGAHDHSHHHDHGAAGIWRLESSAKFAVSTDGLMDSPQMGQVLAKRALALSRDPERESILILAHGPEDDGENRRWIDKITGLAGQIGRAAPFKNVRVETLREDWPEKRREAEARIRGYIERASKDGRVIVLPFRVHGFGPYAKVLKGLEYAADGQGLLPDPAVAEWVAEQAGHAARAQGWPEPVARPSVRAK